MATTTPSFVMANAGPTELTLVKAARVVMLVVFGYILGVGTSQPVIDLLRSHGKLPEHATVQSNTLNQTPTVELRTSKPPHPAPKASK